jgi:hypothetical protein
MKRHAEVETRGGPTPPHPRRHILSPADVVGQGKALEWRDLEGPALNTCRLLSSGGKG